MPYYYYFWCEALTTAPLQCPRGARHAEGTGWGKREACGSCQTACSAKVAQAAATAAAGATANTSGPRSSSLGLGHGHHPYWPPASSKVAKPPARTLVPDLPSATRLRLESHTGLRTEGYGRHAPSLGDEPSRAESLPTTPAKAVGDDLPARAYFPGTPSWHPVA